MRTFFGGGVQYLFSEITMLSLQALYESELEQFKTSMNSVMNGDGVNGLPEEVGGVKVADMPIGREALDVPGRRDGQTKMVKWPAQNKITAHSWSACKVYL